MSAKKAPCVDMKTDMVKDERFAVLGELAGYNRYEAWGRMFALWAWCTDRGLEDAPDDSDGYVVSEAIVIRFLGPRGVVGILADGCDELALAARHGDGRLYLRGTHEYVSARRARAGTASAGGKSRAKAPRVAGRFVSEPTHVQPETSRQPAAHQPRPAPSSSPSSSSSDPESEDQGENTIVRVPILTPPPRLDPMLIPEGWQPSQTQANDDAACVAQARGVVIRGYALEKFVAQMRSRGRRSVDWDAEWRAYLVTELKTPESIRDGLVRVEREAGARAAREIEAERALEKQRLAEDDRAVVRSILSDWQSGAPQVPDDVTLVRAIQTETIARAVIDDEPRCRCGAPPSHGLYIELCGRCGDAELAAKHEAIRALQASRAPPMRAGTNNAASGESRGAEANHPRQPAKEATE